MTLANHLRLTLLVVVTAGAALAAWWLPDTSPHWLALPIGFALPFVFAPIMLGIQVLVGAIVDPRQPRTTLMHVLGVWWRETLASLHVFLWLQPFSTRSDAALVRDPQRPAVLLIHGYVCNRAVWQPLLNAGVLRDCNVATVNLEPVFGDIDGYAEVVAAAIDRLLAASGAARVILVCHSMGGLAARAYLRRFGDVRVDRVITLAAPHHGTVFGRLGMGTNAKQMAAGSPFLEDLAANESEARRAKFVCIATRDDNLLVPRSSPLLPGASERVIEGVGHLALIEDQRAWRIVAEEIRSVARA